jgi:putative transcriptional regulator
MGFVVHSADYRRPETVAVNDRLSMTSSVDILSDIGAKKGPARILVAFGYAGWGPDQLEHEVQVHAWGIAEADPTLVFRRGPGQSLGLRLGALQPASLNAGAAVETRALRPDFYSEFIGEALQFKFPQIAHASRSARRHRR